MVNCAAACSAMDDKERAIADIRRYSKSMALSALMFSSASRVARFAIIVVKIHCLRRRDSVARSTHFCACTAKTGARSVAQMIAQSLQFIACPRYRRPPYFPHACCRPGR